MRLCYNVYIVMAPHIMLAHPTKSPLRQPTPRRNHRITATPHPLSRPYPPPTPADPPQPVTKPRQATPGASICNRRQYFAPVCNRQERNSPWIQSSQLWRSANGNYFQYDLVPVSVRNHIGTMQEPRCRAASKSLFAMIC